MDTKLKIAFEDYTKLLKLELNKITQKIDGNIYRIYFNEIYEINKIIAQLENNESFYELIIKTVETYHSRDEGLGKEEWIDIVQTFFRKSGFYYNCYKKIDTSTINYFDEYQKAMERDIVNLYYIAPIINIDFPVDYIEFDEFKLIKVKEDELDSIINKKIMEIFYPDISFGLDYINELLDNQCILFSKPYKVKGLRGIDYNLLYYGIPGDPDFYKDHLNKWYHFADEIRYTNYPKDLLPILQKLSLFNWEQDYSEGNENDFDIDSPSRGGRFFIPFVIISDDDLISSPYGRSGLFGAVGRPINSPNFFIHPIEAENILFGITFKESDLNTLISFINGLNELFNEITIGGNKWEFLEVSLNSYVKAFFSEGLEQLLWHIISLEALLGAKGKGATERISQRIASIFGKDENQKEAIKKKFKKLHDHRCDLVHGRTFSKTVYTGHLTQVRDLSRRTINWFINYLYAIRNELHKIAAKEKRREILKILDHDQSCVNLNNYLKHLPKGFPYVEKWLE